MKEIVIQDPELQAKLELCDRFVDEKERSKQTRVQRFWQRKQQERKQPLFKPTYFNHE